MEQQSLTVYPMRLNEKYRLTFRFKPQRVRLDCDREASHNLNRLLYKPGGAAVNLLVMEIYL
jgi:hypothetical protein